MKIVYLSELNVGDVFAKEVKPHNRQAYEIVEKPEGKNYILVIQRGEKDHKRMNLKDGQKVTFLRSV